MRLYEALDILNRVLIALNDVIPTSDETLESLPVLINNQLLLKDTIKIKQTITQLTEIRENLEQITSNQSLDKTDPGYQQYVEIIKIIDNKLPILRKMIN